jgi:hypothetical protein
MTSDELPPLTENRAKPRRRVVLGAVAVLGGGNMSFKCRIRDLSADGARIVVPDGQVLPSEIYLINLRDQIAHRAHVVWTRGIESGLNLNASIDLATSTDPSVAFLKSIWRANAIPISGHAGG